MNFASWIILAVVVAIIGLALFATLRGRKKGSCGGGCSSCPYGERCAGGGENKA